MERRKDNQFKVVNVFDRGKEKRETGKRRPGGSKRELANEEDKSSNKGRRAVDSEIVVGPSWQPRLCKVPPRGAKGMREKTSCDERFAGGSRQESLGKKGRATTAERPRKGKIAEWVYRRGRRIEIFPRNSGSYRTKKAAGENRLPGFISRGE